MASTLVDYMSHPAVFIDPDASIGHAATLMRWRNIHSLVVALEGSSLGIVTTTDIRDKIVAADSDPQRSTLRDVMSPPVSTARPEWTSRSAH